MYKRFLHPVLWFRSSIRARLSVMFVLAALIPILLLSGFVSYSANQVIARKEREYVQDKLAGVIALLNDMFTQIERGMVEILSNESLMDAIRDPVSPVLLEGFFQAQRVEQALQSAAARLNEAVSFGIVTAQETVYGSKSASINRFERLDGALAQQIIENAWRTTLFERRLPNYLSTPVITMGKTVKDHNQIIGILFADLSFDWVDRNIAPFSDDAALYILNKEQKVIYSRAQGIPLNDLIQSGATSRERLSFWGKQYLRIESVWPDFGLTAVSLVPESTVFQDSKMNLLHLTVILLVVLLQTLMFARLFAARFSSVILSLNREVKAFGEGGGQKTITISDHSSDEIGQLTQGVQAMSVRIVRMMDTIRQSEREMRRLEIAALQSQINPHMMYNTLNTISYLAQLQGVENIGEITAAFSQMLRLLSKYDGDFITVRQEITYIKSYLTIKKYQLLCNLKVDYEIDPESWDKQILKLLLQPFVENALAHGLSKVVRQAELRIEIKVAGDKMYASVTDNGIGMDEATLQMVLRGEKKNDEALCGVGVANTVERLRLQYEGDCRFDMQSSPGQGTKVLLEFPAEGGHKIA